MEQNEEMKDRVGMYVSLARHITPMVEDVYGVAILQEIGKDVRCDRCIANRNGENGNSNGDQPATPKQIDYLKALGVDFAEGVTKKQASQLIDEATSEHEVIDKAVDEMR